MLDANLLKQLSHTDPEKRKAAVMALAKTKDPNALSYLATLYRNDSNSEVRELARKAGIYINKHSNSGGTSTKRKNDNLETITADDDLDHGTSSTALYEEAEPEELTQDVEVSSLDQERASGLVKQALDLHMRGEDERAKKYLRDALKKNPNLARDSYTVGLAGTIMGMEPEKAIRVALVESKDKAKRKTSDGASSNEPTWGAAFVDLAIYFLINTGLLAVLGFLFMGVGLRIFNEVLVNSPDRLTDYGLSLTDFQTMLDSLATVGVIGIMTFSVVVAFTVVAAQFFYYIVLHMICLNVLGGDGSMPALIIKLTLWSALVSPIFSVISMILSALSFTNPDLEGLTTLASIGLNFGLLFWMSARIGSVYKFGTGKGCASLFVTQIALVMIFCACGLLIPMLTAGSGRVAGF